MRLRASSIVVDQMKLKFSFKTSPELSKTQKAKHRKLSEVWEDDGEMDFGDLTSKSAELKKCRLSRTITDEASFFEVDKEDVERFITEKDPASQVLLTSGDEKDDCYRMARISEAGHTHKSGKSASTKKSKKNKRSLISNRSKETQQATSSCCSG